MLDAARDPRTPESSRALLNRAIALRQARRLDASMAACELLAWVAERIDHPLNVAWRRMAPVVLDLRGDVPGALPHFEKAARIAEEAGDTLTLIAALKSSMCGLLESRELRHQRFRAELLVLSACETARGRIGAGEGLIGLGWAAFLAGSASTIVSQWKVDSRSTADLMIAFHRALQPDASGRRPGTADALRRAALAPARTPAYAHPFYRAGFVAIGDPR